ncbi:MAG: hypothetical protein JRN29_01250 [Nitrososphaerota archaeon]|nr:hypothetical protein [Nitrososphaerota archaeon]
MLVISLIKGVPARTTKVVTVGGVLRREEMEIVMNPHDSKAVEAADYVRKSVGGKTVALTMGPDVKLAPIMTGLYGAQVYGVDEVAILSDRRMAGADTLATSYALAFGIKAVLRRHELPLDELAALVASAGADVVEARAKELYASNLLPNRVYSTLPPVKDSLVHRLARGEVSKEEAIRELKEAKEGLSSFVVIAGVKSTDGETGSVGPQTAEALSEILGVEVPHATYVEDFEVDATSLRAERKMSRMVQSLEMRLPALVTVAAEYRPRQPDPKRQVEVRGNNYAGKVLQPMKWDADHLGADPGRLGLAGSPTIVGPGVDIGKPPVQKRVGESMVFLQKVGRLTWKEAELGPFDEGDLADSLPRELLAELRAKGTVGEFSMERLLGELFR